MDSFASNPSTSLQTKPVSVLCSELYLSVTHNPLHGGEELVTVNALFVGARAPYTLNFERVELLCAGAQLL